MTTGANEGHGPRIVIAPVVIYGTVKSGSVMHNKTYCKNDETSFGLQEPSCRLRFYCLIAAM
ncbi:hypothetical protein GCM10010946_10900 [Undibacterium squillarum]|uniref:Uncharacterized protein n=1 Tax=Undibacterium squillarum TaxID=1131567 RepID=A0ABQ2XVM6_9BURK|nr:hypothetical protein GCM10010946_10900 [Undibacterium squillarum]